MLSTVAFPAALRSALASIRPAHPEARGQRPKDAEAEVSFLGHKAKRRRAESGSGGKQITSPWEVLWKVEGGLLRKDQLDPMENRESREER